MKDAAIFLRASDGFTATGSIAALSWSGEGMLDSSQTDFAIDNTGPMQESYEFVTQVFDSWRSSIGEVLVIGSDNYRVTNAVADATGLLTLSLYME